MAEWEQRIFENRVDAGRKLARPLEKYRDEDVIVLAIPRGGVPVGSEIARTLGKGLFMLVSRKLPLPDNPEAGFGAVAEDGSLFIAENASRWIPQGKIGEIVEEQRQVIERRISTLRGNRPFPDISGRTVIITDDGLAMGSTMRAAVEMCKNKGAGKIVVAVPVSGPGAAAEIASMVDEMIVLEVPPRFLAVAQVYRNWRDLTDEEVIEILGRS